MVRRLRTIESLQCSSMERYCEEMSPEALLVICTDNALDSRLLSQFRSEPLLVWRSTGPVIPPYGPQWQDVARTIDYAVVELGVEEIAICGHLPSDPLMAVMTDSSIPNGPTENPWLYYARTASRIAQEKYGELPQDKLIQAVVEENVFVQMANLCTYPAVLAGLAGGNLRLYRWIYDVEKDELYGHGPGRPRFLNRIEQYANPPSTMLPNLDPCDIYLA